MTATIAIIDYGSGNLASAANAFRQVITREGLDMDVVITDQADIVARADKIVLPGQGAFGDCMEGLSKVDGMIEAMESRVLKGGVPFFGICVGMQLLASRGHEHGVHAGLNWIEGEVVPLSPSDKNLKIPHMGWNEIYCPGLNEQDNCPSLLQGITKKTSQKDAHFYFVHSFMVKCNNKAHILAECDYGGPVTAIIGRDNIAGVQFHPEKSQQAGLNLIANFLHWTV